MFKLIPLTLSVIFLFYDLGLIKTSCYVTRSFNQNFSLFFLKLFFIEFCHKTKLLKLSGQSLPIKWSN